MTTAARHYIATCRSTGQPVNLAEAERLSGLSHGPLICFIRRVQAEVVVPPRKSEAERMCENAAALMAAVEEKERTLSDEHRAAIGRSMRESWNRRKSAAVAA